ncbi:MAG: hypothetical protein KGL35_15435, partial [Bradyrhizobium sp.]|nr:hypothetical protein [Bradyrhizobium sp.]
GRPISHYNPSRATLLRGAAGSRFNQQYGSNARANTHIGTVHINLPNVQQPEQAAPAIGDLFSNPLSPLYTSSPGTRTQRFLPNPLAVPPR